MADTTYRVKYVVEPQVDTAQRKVGELASSFLNLKNVAIGAFASLGVVETTKHLIELNSQLEVTTITIASMFQAGGFAGLTNKAEDFTTAMGMARSEIEQMRKDARDLPGTFDDLMNVFKGGLIGGQMAGKSIAEIEKFAAKMMATGVTLGFDSQTIARDLGMIFSGRLGSHNVMWMQLKKFLKDDKGNNISDAQFKGMDAAKQWATLEKGLKGFEPGIAEFGKTWEAVSSATEDYVKMILRVGSEPIFDLVKGKLVEWNEWFEKNRESILGMAKDIGGKLASAMEQGFGMLKTIFEWIVANKDTLIYIAEAYAATKFVQGVGGVMSAVGAGASFLKTGLSIGAGMGGGGAAGLMSSVGASALAFATSPAVIGAIAAAVIAYGGYKLYQSRQEELAHMKEVNPNGLKSNAVHEALYGRNADASTTQALMFQAGLFKDGQVDLARTQEFLKMFGYSAEAIAEISGRFETEAKKVPMQAQIMAELFDQAKNKLAGPLDNFAFGVENWLRSTTGGIINIKRFSEGDPIAQKLQQQGKPQKPHSTTNVNVKIIQTIENANDPNRVLVKTKEALDSIFKHPITTPTNRFAVVR